jgi:hypothetical protein
MAFKHYFYKTVGWVTGFNEETLSIPDDHCFVAGSGSNHPRIGTHPLSISEWVAEGSKESDWNPEWNHYDTEEVDCEVDEDDESTGAEEYDDSEWNHDDAEEVDGEVVDDDENTGAEDYDDSEWNHDDAEEVDGEVVDDDENTGAEDITAYYEERLIACEIEISSAITFSDETELALSDAYSKKVYAVRILEEASTVEYNVSLFGVEVYSRESGMSEESIRKFIREILVLQFNACNSEDAYALCTAKSLRAATRFADAVDALKLVSKEFAAFNHARAVQEGTVEEVD